MHVIEVERAVQVSGDVAGFRPDEPSRMIEGILREFVTVKAIDLVDIQVETDVVFRVLVDAIERLCDQIATTAKSYENNESNPTEKGGRDSDGT